MDLVFLVDTSSSIRKVTSVSLHVHLYHFVTDRRVKLDNTVDATNILKTPIHRLARRPLTQSVNSFMPSSMASRSDRSTRRFVLHLRLISPGLEGINQLRK